MSVIRPELNGAVYRGEPCPTGGTAYMMIYNAVKAQDGLIAGQLHSHGAHCAIGSFFDRAPKYALPTSLIDEVAGVNDSFSGTKKHRRAMMLRWLRWKLGTLGMPGFERAGKIKP
jgi:hypothetical protein